MKILEVSEEILEYIQGFTASSGQQLSELGSTDEKEEDLLTRLEQFQRMKFSNTRLPSPKREK
jgi:hypothetical protein